MLNYENKLSKSRLNGTNVHVNIFSLNKKNKICGNTRNTNKKKILPYPCTIIFASQINELKIKISKQIEIISINLMFLFFLSYR